MVLPLWVKEWPWQSGEVPGGDGLWSHLLPHMQLLTAPHSLCPSHPAALQALQLRSGILLHEVVPVHPFPDVSGSSLGSLATWTYTCHRIYHTLQWKCACIPSSRWRTPRGQDFIFTWLIVTVNTKTPRSFDTGLYILLYTFTYILF